MADVGRNEGKVVRVSEVEKELAHRMGDWLQREIEAQILSGQPVATSVVQTDQAIPLTLESLVETVARLRTEQREKYGPPVRALKLGRAQVNYVRRFMVQHQSWTGPAIGHPDQLYGVPFYEVDAVDYFEPIYEAEAPTLDALNKWLERAPRALWGKVVAE